MCRSGCHAGGKRLGEVRLQIAGRHNALNALATIAVALEVDIDFQVIADALSQFSGTDRRFQRIASIGDILIVDDYGHHPTEIRAVLATAREAFDRRTIVCFQPHRYSRSQLLHEEFSRCFDQADTLFVLPIYAASERPILGVTASAMAAAIREHGHEDVRTPESLEEAIEALAGEVKSGDLVLTLGAGVVWKIGPALATHLNADADNDSP
jgi:UDP-N-acetylmuramate--alanine ligase